MELLSTYKKCPHCGEDNVRGAKYCTYCHNAMDTANIPPPYQSQKSSPTPWQYGKEPARSSFEYPQCQGSANQQPPLPPRNYIVEAILVSIFCCQPFGIVAIVLAANINSEYRLGNYERAAKLSRQAGIWVTVSLITGLIVGLLYAILNFMGEMI